MLEVLEAISAHQPIGLAELAQALEGDKNAIQRALVTLAEAGWITPADGARRKWELTSRVLAVAHNIAEKSDIRLRARAELEALREAAGETALLSVPEKRHFVVADVIESRQVLRTAPAVGTIILPHRSATGFAVLSYMRPNERLAYLDEEPDDALLSTFEEACRNGYAVAINTPIHGITVVAAAVFDAGGLPIAAISIVAPTERATAQKCSEFGSLVAKAARRLSNAEPREIGLSGRG